MDDLRLILLLLGIALLLLIYLWGTVAERRGQKKQTVQQAEPGLGLRDLNEQDFLPAEQEPGPVMPLMETKAPDREQSASVKQKSNSAEQEAAVDETTELIVLHITALPEKPFGGSRLLRALALVEMEYGEMDIFHHYGTAKVKSDQALFSLANMYEPGCFDLQNMEKEHVRGLSLFLRLPAPVDAQPAFELMLHTARRLADELGGEVRAAGHEPLDEDALAKLRNKTMAFSNQPITRPDEHQ